MSALATDDQRRGDGWLDPAQADELRKLTATCSCGTSPMTYEGPEPDCSVHGAVRALNQAMAERAVWLPVIDAARRAVAGAYAAAAKGLSFYVSQDLVAAVDALDRGVSDA